MISASAAKTHSFRMLAILGATVTFLGACSNNDAETTTDGTAAEETAATDSAGTGSGQRLTDDIGPDRYTTSGLDVPITFTTNADLVTQEDSDGLLALGLPDGDPTDAVLVFSPVGVAAAPQTERSDGADFSLAPIPTDLGAWIEESPQLEVVSSGTFESSTLGPIGFWDIRTSPAAERTSPCSVGDKCTPVFVYGDNQIVAISDNPNIQFRVFDVTDETASLIVLTQTTEQNREALSSTAESILNHLCFCGELEPTSPAGEDVVKDSTQLAAAPLESVMFEQVIPPGIYSTIVGEVEITVDAVEGLKDVGLAVVLPSEGAIFVLSEDGRTVGSALVANAKLVDPAQTNQDPDLSMPDTIDGKDVESWVADSGRFDILDSGTTTVGGEPSHWWDLAARADLGPNDTYECFQGSEPAPPFTSDDRCLAVHVGEGGSDVLIIGLSYRLYFLDDFDVIMSVSTELQSPPPSAQALFDALSIAEPTGQTATTTDAAQDDRNARLEYHRTAAAQVPSEPNLETFCQGWADSVRADELDTARNTPIESEMYWTGNLDHELQTTINAPEAIRWAAEGSYASTLRFLEVLEQYNWHEDELPAAEFAVGVDEELDALFGFLEENCPAID